MSEGRWGTRLRSMSTLAVATAIMFGGGALMLAANVVSWTPDRNPRSLLFVLALLSANAAVIALVFNHRLHRGVVLAMVTGELAVLAGLSAGTPSSVAALSNGTTIPVIAAFSTWFLHPVWGRVVVYAGALSWMGVVVVRDVPAAGTFAFQILLQTVLAAEAFAMVRRIMDRLATTDTLTGLPNRRGIIEYAAHVLARTARRDQRMAIVMIDIDGLREVNNAGGHGAGDRLIRDFSDHLSAHLGRGQRLGRIGGDEFVMVLPGCDEIQAHRLLSSARQDGPSSWSAGIAIARAGDDLDRVLDQADQQMYIRKRSRTDPAAGSVSG